MISSWRTRYGLHASTSCGLGFRLPGGRCLRTLHEHVLAAQINGAEDLGKQLARHADEREAGLIFVLTGRFADAHQFRCGPALPGHELRGGLVERTSRALRHEFVERLER